MNSIIIEYNSSNQNEKCLSVLMIMHTNVILTMHDDFPIVHYHYDDHTSSIVTILMILTFSYNSHHSFLLKLLSDSGSRA
jgi:hypothetical protein